MTTIDKLAWIHIKNNKLLVARSKNKTTYYIPGGKREPGESDQEALIREINEELLIDLLPETIQYAGTFEAQAHDKPAGTLVKMTCYYADYVGTLKANAEIEEITWFNYCDKDKTSVVTQIIMEWLKSKNSIE